MLDGRGGLEHRAVVVVLVHLTERERRAIEAVSEVPRGTEVPPLERQELPRVQAGFRRAPGRDVVLDFLHVICDDGEVVLGHDDAALVSGDLAVDEVGARGEGRDLHGLGVGLDGREVGCGQVRCRNGCGGRVRSLLCRDLHHAGHERFLQHLRELCLGQGLEPGAGGCHPRNDGAAVVGVRRRGGVGVGLRERSRRVDERHPDEQDGSQRKAHGSLRSGDSRIAHGASWCMQWSRRVRTRRDTWDPEIPQPKATAESPKSTFEIPLGDPAACKLMPNMLLLVD